MECNFNEWSAIDKSARQQVQEQSIIAIVPATWLLLVPAFESWVMSSDSCSDSFPSLSILNRTGKTWMGKRDTKTDACSWIGNELCKQKRGLTDWLIMTERSDNSRHVGVRCYKREATNTKYVYSVALTFCIAISFQINEWTIQTNKEEEDKRTSFTIVCQFDKIGALCLPIGPKGHTLDIGSRLVLWVNSWLSKAHYYGYYGHQATTTRSPNILVIIEPNDVHWLLTWLSANLSLSLSLNKNKWVTDCCFASFRSLIDHLRDNK